MVLVGGFVYIVDIVKNMLSVVNIVVYVMQVCEIVMECYVINCMIEVMELFYFCNGMIVMQKYEVIQVIFM